MPTIAGFIAFIRSQMGITALQLPDNSPDIVLAYDMAIEIVNLTILQAAPNVYTIAVYNLGCDNLINYATDTPPSTLWSGLRAKYNIYSFVAGVIASSGDESTNQSLATPESLKELTLADLQNLKSPWGRQYLAIAQKYGPLWGLS